MTNLIQLDGSICISPIYVCMYGTGHDQHIWICVRMLVYRGYRRLIDESVSFISKKNWHICYIFSLGYIKVCVCDCVCERVNLQIYLVWNVFGSVSLTDWLTEHLASVWLSFRSLLIFFSSLRTHVILYIVCLYTYIDG